MNLSKHRRRLEDGGAVVLLFAFAVFAATMIGMGVEWVLDHAPTVSKYVGTIVGGLLLVYFIGHLYGLASE